MFISEILPSYGILGNRTYELSNHLGNVLTVINDVKYPISDDNTTISGYEVGINGISDYSPFGAPLDGRTMNKALTDEGGGFIEKQTVFEDDFEVGSDWDATSSNTSIAYPFGVMYNKNSSFNTAFVGVKHEFYTDGEEHTLSFDANLIPPNMCPVPFPPIIIPFDTNSNDQELNGGLSPINRKNHLVYLIRSLNNDTILIDSVETVGSYANIPFTISQSGTYVIEFFVRYVCSEKDFRIDNVKIEAIKSNSEGGFVVANGYRYGFNSQERDDEVSGEGNSYTAEFWQYSPRLGRRWERDPKPNFSISSYATFGNNPIFYSDPYGDTVKLEGSKRDIRKFVRQLSKTSGNKLDVTKDGILYNRKDTYNDKTTKRKSGILSELTEAIITDNEIFTFDLSRNNNSAYFDDYDEGEVDVGEFEKSDRIFRAGQFAHIFMERMSNNPNFSRENRNDKNYEESHSWGMIAEGAVVTSMLNIDYAYPKAKSYPHKDVDQYGNSQIYFWEATKYGKALFGGKRTAIQKRNGSNLYKPGANLIGRMKIRK